MPDATGLELLAQELREPRATARAETVFFRERATLEIDPAQIRAVLETLRGKGYAFLASVHGVDYYPQEPRLGVVYELLDMSRVDRDNGQAARAQRRARGRFGRPTEWPTANHQEREVYDMFGVVFARASGPAADPDARGLRGPPPAARLPDRRRTGDLHPRRDQLAGDARVSPTETRALRVPPPRAEHHALARSRSSSRATTRERRRSC